MPRQDVTISPNEIGLYDLVVDGADFASSTGLETSIAVSLFSDARADKSTVPEPSRRRGWVGDSLTIDIDRSIGSILWRFEQSRITNDIANQVRLEAISALQWMIDDGIALAVDVRVERTQTEITITIDMTRKDSSTERYQLLWRGTDATRISNI